MDLYLENDLENYLARRKDENNSEFFNDMEIV